VPEYLQAGGCRLALTVTLIWVGLLKVCAGSGHCLRQVLHLTVRVASVFCGLRLFSPGEGEGEGEGWGWGGCR